jgi:tetratricopeptide (TPR) repeat protein
VETQLRYALQLSSASARNITTAYRACIEWDTIFSVLDKAQTKQIDDSVVALARALQASCLVRIGQDEQALVSYDEALKFQRILDDKTRNDLIVGKATAYQRLLRYQEAMNQFRLSTTGRGALGGATCAMRLGNVQDAIEILEVYVSSSKQGSLPEVSLMLATLRLLSRDGRDSNNCSKLLGSSWMYSWISRILCPGESLSSPSDYPIPSFLDLIQINQSPFDDPDLLWLDDKVKLHTLLEKYRERTTAFWPKGMILSHANLQQNEAILQEYPSSTAWIRKTRSGYGSHGNVLMTTGQALDMIQTQSLPQEDERLLQQVVKSPLLLDGKKFSIRIYVVYFSKEEHAIYLSDEGLVKLAAVALDAADSASSTGINNDRMHMTNSGREATMDQYDLSYLAQKFVEQGLNYEEFWNDIRSTVTCVMQCYIDDTSHDRKRSFENIQRLFIPKILGLDFLVSSSAKPWLLEINRFPGLEPRDSSDIRVKSKVVYDAWTKASERAKLAEVPQILSKMDPESAQSHSSLSSISLG